MSVLIEYLVIKMISCTFILATIVQPFGYSSTGQSNNTCNPLSESEYEKFDCLSKSMTYPEYLEEINTLSKSSKQDCDKYNRELSNRNKVACDNLLFTAMIEMHGVKKLSNDRDYNYMCGYKECLRGKYYPPKSMALNEILQIQFVKITPEFVAVKFLNKLNETIDVGSITNEIELRAIKGASFKKIHYDSGVIAIVNDNTIVLPEYVDIQPNESFIVVYAFNTNKYKCKDLSIYLKTDKGYLFSSFIGTTECDDPDAIGL